MRFYLTKAEIAHAHKKLEAIPAKGFDFSALPSRETKEDLTQVRMILAEVHHAETIARPGLILEIEWAIDKLDHLVKRL